MGSDGIGWDRAVQCAMLYHIFWDHTTFFLGFSLFFVRTILLRATWVEPSGQSSRPNPKKAAYQFPMENWLCPFVLLHRQRRLQDVTSRRSHDYSRMSRKHRCRRSSISISPPISPPWAMDGSLAASVACPSFTNFTNPKLSLRSLLAAQGGLYYLYRTSIMIELDVAQRYRTW